MVYDWWREHESEGWDPAQDLGPGRDGSPVSDLAIFFDLVMDTPEDTPLDLTES